VRERESEQGIYWYFGLFVVPLVTASYQVLKFWFAKLGAIFWRV
jgi:hypothetical protein